MYNYYYRQNLTPFINQGKIPATIPTTTQGQSQPTMPTTTQGQSQTTMPKTAQGQSQATMPTTTQGQSQTTMPKTTQGQSQPTTPTMNQGQSQPFSQLQSIIADINELYHKETMDLDTYKRLLQLSPNTENAEVIENIIENTENNLMTLRQIYLGLTGNTLEETPMQSRMSESISYNELLRNSLLSKLDTLDSYEILYRTIPIRPYKDVLFKIIIKQVKDASFCNYLISISL